MPLGFLFMGGRRYKRGRIMKILVLLIANFLALASISFALSMQLFGYTISYEPQQVEVINMQEQISQIQTYEFNEYVAKANNRKETQIILKELDYSRIGFINWDTSKSYTAVISQEGIITGVYIGLLEPEVIVEGSITQIKQNIADNNFLAVGNSLKVPFKLKLKLLLMRFW